MRQFFRKITVLVAAVIMFFVVYPVHPSFGDTMLNVKDFGAMGDGLTDDTAAIQKAINSASQQEIPLFFPQGTYNVKQLLLPDHTTITGQGAEMKEAADSYSLILVKGSHVSISGMTLEGSSRTYVGISVLANINDVNISNTTIQNISQPLNNPYPTHIPSGIRIYEGTKGIVVDGVTIKNVYSTYKWVTGAPPIARGILITPNDNVYSPSEVVIKNSTIDGVGPKDDGDGICVQLFKTKVNVQILNNTFLHNQKRAIKIQSPGAVISGNKISNSYNKNNYYKYQPDPKWYDMWAAISVYANDVNVLNNQITGIGNYGAAIDIAGGNNVLVNGNTIENGIHSNYKNGNLIVVSRDFQNNINFSNITITKNTVKNGRYGIVISAKVKNLSVYGNKAVNVIKGYVK